MQLYALHEGRYKFWQKSKGQFFRKAENKDELGKILKTAQAQTGLKFLKRFRKEKILFKWRNYKKMA